ncbi:MAG: DUF4159 domain-containing protein [Myxococcaceae bacterium]
MARISRRHFLTACAAIGVWPRASSGFGEASKFVPAVAMHRGRWDARHSGLRRLAWELQQRTSVEVLLDVRPLPLVSPKLFEHPFLYMGSEGGLPRLGDDEVENLRRYLTYGGFLVVDAWGDAAASTLDTDVRRELARILPQSPLFPLPPEHVIFKSYFLLESAPGRFLRQPGLWGAKVGEHVGVVYTPNDLLGAFARDESGEYAFDVSPGGEQQREFAFRLGVNLCMYALCLDYKDDAVHLPLILNKRR